MWLIWIIIIALVGINIGWICIQILWQFPERRSILSYPRCKNCNKPFRPSHNIPILGFILSKGKCSYCDHAFPSYVVIIPIITPVLFVALYLKMQLSVLFFQFSLLTIVGILIFFFDLHYRIVPDILTLPMIGCGIFFSFFNGLGLWFAVRGFVFGAGIFVLIALLFRLVTKRDGMGGGDIKLVAMIGLFLGLRLTFLTIFISSVLGMVIYAFSSKRNKTLIPYGSFIVMAMFASIMFGNELISWYLRLWGI